MYLTNTLFLGILWVSFPAPSVSAGEPCKLRLELTVDTDAGVSYNTAYAILTEALCEMRNDFMQRGTQGLGKRAGGVLKYLDGRKNLRVMVRRNVFAETRAWLIFPFGPKRIRLGSVMFKNDASSIRFRRKNGSEMLAISNPRKNLKCYLLHELIHAAGFFLSLEKTAYGASRYYYPEQDIYRIKFKRSRPPKEKF